MPFCEMHRSGQEEGLVAAGEATADRKTCQEGSFQSVLPGIDSRSAILALLQKMIRFHSTEGKAGLPTKRGCCTKNGLVDP